MASVDRTKPRECVVADGPEVLCSWVCQLLVSIPLLEKNATELGDSSGYLVEVYD